MQLFSCSHQVHNSYCEVQHTTIIVLNYLNRVIIQYMFFIIIHILKATRRGLSTGDFSSASRYKTQECCQQMSKAQAGTPVQVRAIRMFDPFQHGGLHCLCSLYCQFSVKCYWCHKLRLRSGEQLSQHISLCMKIIPLVFQFPLFWVCMTRSNITLRGVYIIHQSKKCFNINFIY